MPGDDTLRDRERNGADAHPDGREGRRWQEDGGGEREREARYGSAVHVIDVLNDDAVLDDDEGPTMTYFSVAD